MAASLAFTLFFSSCSDLTLPVETSKSEADLIVLSLRAGAPRVTPRSFWISNTRRTIERVEHSDNFNTTFLEIEFPSGSIESLNGVPLAIGDSLMITISPQSGEYGFTVSPPGIIFSSNSTPSVTVFFGAYGDASVGTSSGSYANTTDFLEALDIWREQSVDLWIIERNSASAGTDAWEARVEASGRFLLAAPR